MKSYNTTTIGKSLLLLLLALSVQGCLGIGNNSSSSSSNGPVGNTITTNSSGNKVSVAQNLFKGKIYFTIDHNLWVTDGSSASRELIHGGNVYDPAVSPDGKWIAFTARFKDFTNLAAIPAGGGPVHILLSGGGHFYNDTGIIKNTYHWFAQPAWSLDGTHLLFLSDLQKDFVWYTLGEFSRILLSWICKYSLFLSITRAHSHRSSPTPAMVMGEIAIQAIARHIPPKHPK